MMNDTGIGEGVQAVRVMFEGIDMFLKLSGQFTSWSFDKLSKLFSLVYGAIKEKKLELKPGEVTFAELINKDRQGVGIMQLDNSAFAEFTTYAKEMGLSYSIMPDINKQDTCIEIAYGEMQGEAIRYFIAQNPEFARTYTYGEYIDNADEKDILDELNRLDPNREAIQYAEELKKEGKEDNSVQQQPTNTTKNMRYEDVAKQTDSQIVEIDKELIAKGRNDREVLLGVPNRENEYILIPIERLTKKNNKIYAAFLATDIYDVVDKDLSLCNKRISSSDFSIAVKNVDYKNLVNATDRENISGKTRFVLNEKNGIQQKIIQSDIVDSVKEKSMSSEVIKNIKQSVKKPRAL